MWYGRRKTTLGELRNAAVSAAEGSILIQWDDDDWYSSERIEMQYRAMVHGAREPCAASCELRALSSVLLTPAASCVLCAARCVRAPFSTCSAVFCTFVLAKHALLTLLNLTSSMADGCAHLSLRGWVLAAAADVDAVFAVDGWTEGTAGTAACLLLRYTLFESATGLLWINRPDEPAGSIMATREVGSPLLTWPPFALLHSRACHRLPPCLLCRRRRRHSPVHLPCPCA